MGETHRFIAENIARELQLKEKSKDLLVEGSLAPDTLRDFPHHSGKDQDIISHLVDAVRYFQENNDQCYVELGKALHYIQDKWVSRPGSLEAHSKWEQYISERPILNNEALIKHVETYPFPSEVKQYYKELFGKVSKGVGTVSLLEYDSLPPWIKHMNSEAFAKMSYFAINWSHPKSASGEPYSTPMLDLNIAYMFCLQIVRCVLSPQTDWSKRPVSISELETKKAKLKKMEKRFKLWILIRLLYTYTKSISLLAFTNLLFFGFAHLVLGVFRNLPQDESSWGLGMFALIFGPFFIGIFLFSASVVEEGREFKFAKDILMPGLVSAFFVQILYLFYPYGLDCFLIQNYLLSPMYFVSTRLQITKRMVSSLRADIPQLEEEIRRRLEEERKQGMTVIPKGKTDGKDEIDIYQESYPELNEEERALQETQEVDMDFEDEVS